MITVFIIRVPNYWGSGSTLKEAEKSCRSAGGGRYLRAKKYRHADRLDFPDKVHFEIHPVDGCLSWYGSGVVHEILERPDGTGVSQQ